MNLKAVIFGSNVSYVGSSFFVDCPELSILIVPQKNKYLNTYDGIVYTKDFSQIVVVPNKLIGDITLHDNLTYLDGTILFSNQLFISSITINKFPKSLNELIFANCTSLKEIALPSDLEYIRKKAFANCSSLTKIKLPDTIKEIDQYAFTNCSSLTEIVLPPDLTHIKIGTFRNCINLKSISLPEKLEEIESYAFDNCSSLSEINFPFNLKTINEYAFYKCTNLRSITLNGKVDFQPIAFEECHSLSFFHIPENNPRYIFKDDILYLSAPYLTVVMSLDSKTERVLNENVTKIGIFAFYNNKKLKKIILPENLREISELAFCNCTNLESIFIPSQVDYVESRAFLFCNKLTSIQVSKNNENLASFDDCIYAKNYVSLLLIPSGKNKIVFHEKFFLMNKWAYLMCELMEIKIPEKIRVFSYKNSPFDEKPGIFEICTGNFDNMKNPKYLYYEDKKQLNFI